MQTSTLVQASATVVTVTNLTEGDVYKRLDDRYGNSSELLFGIVTSVMHNGTDAAVVALEFSATFGSAEVKLKTFGTGADLKLFPATPAEVEATLEEVRATALRAVEAAERTLASARAVLGRVDDIRGQVATGGQVLTAAATAPAVVAELTA